MKKSELTLKLEQAFQEGVMDGLSTQLSRRIVNHLKKWSMEPNIPSFKGQVNDLLLRVDFARYHGPLKHSGGAYNNAYRELAIRISVPEQFNDRELNAFIPTLKNVIRHELEHYRQDQRSGYESPDVGTHYADPATSRDAAQAHKPGVAPYSSIEAARSYFLSSHEIEAWVMGLYKQAKTEKKPLLDLMASETTKIAGHLQNYGHIDRKESFKFAKELSQAWKSYAEKRIPNFSSSTFGILPH